MIPLAIANAANTSVTRPRMLLACLSWNSRCRLKMTTDTMKGSTIIFSRST